MSADNLPRRGLTFAAASFSILTAFGASALPVPLMARWTDAFHLTTGAIGMTVVAYVAGCFLALLFLARLSEGVGRRGAVLAGLVFGVLSTIVLLRAQAPADLMTARLLQGLYCGVTTTAAMSWAVDAAPLGAPWLGAAMSSAGPLLGFVAATVAAGVVLETGAAGPAGIFTMLLVLQSAAALLTLCAAETLRSRNMRRAFTPAVIPPAGCGRRLAVSAAGIVGTWALTCFFQGFSAKVAAQLWGADAPLPLLSSAVYLMLVLPNAAGGFASARFEPKRIVPPAAALFGIFGTAAFAAAALKAPMLYVPAMVLCGLMQGALTAQSLKLLLAGSSPADRARLIAAVYLIGYLGTGIPNFCVMAAGGAATFTNIALGFALWFALTFAAVLFFLKRLEAAQSAASATSAASKPVRAA